MATKTQLFLLGIVLIGLGGPLVGCRPTSPPTSAPSPPLNDSTLGKTSSRNGPSTSEASPTAEPPPVTKTAPVASADVEILTTTQRREAQSALSDEFQHGDQRGDWDTEAFHEAVKGRLHILFDALTGGDAEQAKLSELLSSTFQSTPLHPPSSELVLVFQDANMEVMRRRGVTRMAPTSVDQLRAALAALAEPFRERSKIAVHYKIYRVDIQDRVGTSVMYVDTDGAAERGRVQQDMTITCGWEFDAQQTWRLTSIELGSFDEIHYHAPHGKLFSDCTEGMLGPLAAFRTQFLHGVDHWRLNFEEAMGVDAAALMGLAIGDVNGDGLDDVYYSELGGLPNRLLVQQPDGSVRDTSAEAGVNWLDRGRGALFADFDNDGDQDLAVTVGSQLAMMRNDGTGRFHIVTQLRPHPTAYGLAAADYDNDGRLDLYVCSYGNNYETFSDSVAPLPYHDANNGIPNTLFRNVGDWKFEDVTVQVGLDVNNRRFSFGASWEDFDNDGDQDLCIANDFGRKNLYINEINTSGKFRDVAHEYQVEDSGSGMSVDWGDYDNDGRMDLWIGNMWSSAGNRITFQDRFLPNSNNEQLDAFRRFARGNSLFRNSGSAPFEDVSERAGVTNGRWAWTSLMADLNNDAWLDLVVTNGHVTGVEPDDL